MPTITRQYQLGGSSTFVVRDADQLARAIAGDRASRAVSGDMQGIRYLATRDDAVALGGYPAACGCWLVPLPGGAALALDIE